MSKRNRTKERRELKEEYDVLPGGDKKSLRIEDLDIPAAVKRAANYENDVVIPEKIAKVETAVSEFEEVIETEEQFLEFFNPDRLKIEVVALIDNSYKLLKFNLKSIESTDDLSALQVDLSIYAELSDLEKSVMVKGAQTPELLTDEEDDIYKSTTKKLEENMSGSLLDQVHDILCTYVTPPTGDRDKRLAFWLNVPFDIRTFVATSAMRRLGISPESDVKLFQAS